MIRTGKIAEITEAQTLSFHADLPIHHLLLDSRKVVSAADAVFFAIKGVRHDGHQYISSLYQKGIRCFIIEDVSSFRLKDFPEASFWLVSSAVTALQQIVAWHRAQFHIPVVGITGSNGKTIVKEWLSQLLNKDFRIIKNPKSYNSQVGVPLSVWGMDEYHTLGIFEAGISLPGEMENLEKVIQPSIGLFTNIGPAHDEGFETREEKIREKLKLFAHAEVAFYRKDYPAIEKEMAALSAKRFCWSDQQAADVQVLKKEKNSKGVLLTLLYQDKNLVLHIPFTDEASLENILHCVCVLFWLKISVEEIQERINTLLPVAMRLELKEGLNGSYLIDDTYNNDFAGLTMAINFLDQQKQRAKKTVILSDLLESGVNEEKLYAQISELLREKNISRLIGIGKNISRYQNVFQNFQTSFYESTRDFLSSLKPDTFSNEIILLKGARVFAFEQIVRRLQQKMHGTILEINLDALAHNLNFYRSQLKSGTKIMVMVKAFAYGSGSFEVANLLQFHRVDYLAVAYADEGVALREHGITMPVMVMNPSYQTFDKIIQYQLEPEIYSFKILEEFLQYLQENNSNATIHLKLDTGMHRLGFEEKDLDLLIEKMKNSARLHVASIFTHLAAADEAVHNHFTEAQLEKFTHMADRLEAALGYTTIRHAVNSAGILRFPQAQMNMVRLGVGLYGVEASGQRQSELQTVGTLKTIVSQIKKVSAGESVGYSRKGMAEKPTTIATIAIGYADGYDRGFSNGKGKVMINGTLCPIIGNVCMDMCMVDITGVEVAEGDEVIVFGKNPSILELSKEIGTIPYELLTGIGERVKRVFYTE
ncbi:MAG TPA: bifunctional UDP-N-acetylmuramoyl-tripeptide:D-alanyl-D-alanine ligase/alanine racemase [Cytophagaceae bacterium]|nr:bifunctional UDP-N-acetylmuramoyl-tripeptide:D-alanyl-D-alanine ligase/alanine racemase [Cytophagaceae bacterium]